jgi:hypothetical protein
MSGGRPEIPRLEPLFVKFRRIRAHPAALRAALRPDRAIRSNLLAAPKGFPLLSLARGFRAYAGRKSAAGVGRENRKKSCSFFEQLLGFPLVIYNRMCYARE